MSMVLRDRNGREAVVGAHVRIQHCVGRYGQVEIVGGVLERLDMPFGVTLRLDHQVRVVGLDGGVRYVGAGALHFLALTGKVKDGAFHAAHQHVDFEHGHETWLEVSPSEADRPIIPHRLDEWASVGAGPTSVPGVWVPKGAVFRGMDSLEEAKAYADEVAAFFGANGCPAVVFVVRGPTTTTRKAYEVVDASCGYSIQYRALPPPTAFTENEADAAERQRMR